jgi:mRNA-degrading endonuclease RelE of RelBE toxin-antitoxin system
MAAILTLADDPGRGKPLAGALAGYLSIQALRSKYRIVYHIDDNTVVVLVVAAGPRLPEDEKDVYRELVRLLSSQQDAGEWASTHRHHDIREA